MAASQLALFTPDVLRRCTRTVMDNTDPDIAFDENGVSNWWHEFHALRAARPDAAERDRLLQQTITAIKDAGRGKPYDCILGLSGGVDSSYMAYLARRWSLRPLVVHFDNGWNDELAVANIEVIVRKLGFRLSTFVMNWPEFRDLQRAFFKAAVLDLEMPTDHMIFGALYRIAHGYGIKHILSGNNFATEWLLPRAWYYAKGDLENIKGIHRSFGEQSMKHLPGLGVWQRQYYQRVKRVREVQVLELIDYRKNDAKKCLMQEFGWRDYGGKHYESLFTRFYQGYILPTRYGIDKRKAHLSNLICNGEISRDDALMELARPPYDPNRQAADKRFVAKKLGWSEAEFDQILALPARRHEEFGTDARTQRMAAAVIKCSRPLIKLGKVMVGA